MNSQRTPAGITDEEWIAKYRAALDRVPVPQSPWLRLRTALGKALKILDANIGPAVHRGMAALIARRPENSVRAGSNPTALRAISHDDAGGYSSR